MENTLTEKKGLTKRQKEVLDFITQYINKHKYSPSYREIMKNFNFNSTASVYKHIKILERKGYLVSEKNGTRSLRPPEKKQNIHLSQDTTELPLFGQVSEGSPIETFAHVQAINVSKKLIPQANDIYAMRIQGNGFHSELLKDGDIIILGASSSAPAASTILAEINEHTSLIKRYFPEGQYAKLESHSTSHLPTTIRHENLKIHGIIIASIRVY